MSRCCLLLAFAFACDAHPKQRVPQWFAVDPAVDGWANHTCYGGGPLHFNHEETDLGPLTRLTVSCGQWRDSVTMARLSWAGWTIDIPHTICSFKLGPAYLGSKLRSLESLVPPIKDKLLGEQLRSPLAILDLGRPFSFKYWVDGYAVSVALSAEVGTGDRMIELEINGCESPAPWSPYRLSYGAPFRSHPH